MVTSSSITLQPARTSGLVLSSDRLLTALRARGYYCEVSQLAGVQSLPPGLSLLLQFGDTITVSADGVPTMVIRCGVQISDGRGRETERWKVQKTVTVAEPQPLSIVIEADVTLSKRVVLADLLSDQDGVYWHLGLLLNDLHHTLQTIPISRRCNPTVDIPAARLEARFFGEVVAGRSGLARQLKGERSLLLNSRQILQVMRTGCEVLRNDIVFELAGVVRGVVTPIQGPDCARGPGQRSRGEQPMRRDHTEATFAPARATCHDLNHSFHQHRYFDGVRNV